MGEISAFYTMPHPPIIIPEVGKGEEAKIQASYDACEKVAREIASIKPDTIIIVTPHGPMFSDAVAISTEQTISGDLGGFGAPQVKLSLNINQDLTSDIIRRSQAEGLLVANISKDSAKQYGIDYALDHGSLVPLYFIDQELSAYNIVHITYGMVSKLELYKLGMLIQEAVEDSHTKAVFIASGDLSHKLSNQGPYSYNPNGEKFDKTLLALLEKGDVSGIFNMDPHMIQEAGECGLRTYYIMLGAMNGYTIEGNLLSYEGTFGVGYPVMSFNLKPSHHNTYHQLISQQNHQLKTKIQNESPYVKLARESLTHYLNYGEYMDIPADVTDSMVKTKRGVFVTLHKEGALRGCIGTIFPVTESIAGEIIRNAVEAGLNDPRFSAVTEAEIAELDFSVDVLTKPKKALESELDPDKYGIILRSGPKTGLLLPQLEGINTVEKQLEIALDKGNISPDEKYTIEKFEVVRYY